MMTPKQETERLMNAMLPLAEKMLRQHGEFYPYGGYMARDGTIVDVGAGDPDTDRPSSRDLVYGLRTALEELARTKKCKAAAIVLNVSVNLSGTNRKSDAIQICVEHEDGYSAEVFFPYQILNDDIVYGDTFAQEGKCEIFSHDSA
jgi:hypothetical protein